MFSKYGLFFTTFLFTLNASAGADWNYKTPENWSKINDKYHACSGLNQSPIDIQNTIQAQLPPLTFNYDTTAKNIKNNGHTVQVEFNQGATLELDNKKFKLKQFHLHSPSENTILGKSYPMELHLVHVSDKGELAVVALMFESGEENEKLQHIWNVLPKKIGENKPIHTMQKASNYLPAQLEYYRFNGSLTTPPCTEGVRWLVVKETQSASDKQIQQFSELMGHPNNRPIQPLNGRIITEN